MIHVVTASCARPFEIVARAQIHMVFNIVAVDLTSLHLTVLF